MYQSLADSVPSVVGDGFRLTELRPGAVDRSRETKPVIPELGGYGIPLRDELDLEREIPPAAMN